MPATDPRALWSRVSVSVAAIGLFNLPLWLQSFRGELDRAVFNLDGLIALAIGFCFRSAGLLAVVIAWALDVLLAQSNNYYFRSPIDFLESARFGGALHWGEIFTWKDGLLASSFFVAAVLLWRLFRRMPSWATLAAALLSLAVADSLNGSSELAMRDIRLVQANIAGSPAFIVGRAFTKKPPSVHPGAFADPESGRLFDAVLGWSRTHPEGSILVVLVESLGLPVAPPLQSWLQTQLLAEGRQHHSVQAGSVLFIGATTAGELRTLCMLDGSYNQLDMALGATCLPSRLAKAGWQVHGYHGFTGNMFERRAWWPLIGLQDASFAEHLRGQGLPLCGAAFRGFCDADVLDLAGSNLKPHAMAYVLTLNTHLPLPPQQIDAGLQALCRANEVPDAACAAVSATGAVLRRIGSLARKSPNTLMLVAGDHAPPLQEGRSRRAFDDRRVPAWLLTPAVASAVPPAVAR